MNKQIDEILEAVLSGRYGTKNRAELIQRLENLKNPPGVSQWMQEGKKWGYWKYFKSELLRPHQKCQEEFDPEKFFCASHRTTLREHPTRTTDCIFGIKAP